MMLSGVLAALLLSDSPPPCAYPEDFFIGTWIADVPDEIVDNDSHIFDLSAVGTERKWAEWLHFRPMDSGSWVYTKCGEVLLAQRAGSHSLTAKALGPDQVEIDQSIYLRVRDNLPEAG